MSLFNNRRALSYNMWTLIQLLTVLCSLHMFAAAKVTKTFPFENVVGGPGKSRSPWRSNALGSASLHVFKGDTINIDICLSGPTEIALDDIVYSNDGKKDILRVSVDNDKIVETIVTAGNDLGWGKLWNDHKSTGPIAQPTKLAAGRHTLSISVEDADCYGTELDTLFFSLDVDIADSSLWCGSELIHSTKPSPCAKGFELPKPADVTTNVLSTLGTSSTITSGHVTESTSYQTELGNALSTSATPISTLLSRTSTSGLAYTSTKSVLQQTTAGKSTPTTAILQTTSALSQTPVNDSITGKTIVTVSADNLATSTTYQTTSESINATTFSTKTEHITTDVTDITLGRTLSQSSSSTETNVDTTPQSKIGTTTKQESTTESPLKSTEQTTPNTTTSDVTTKSNITRTTSTMGNVSKENVTLPQENVVVNKTTDTPLNTIPVTTEYITEGITGQSVPDVTSQVKTISPTNITEQTPIQTTISEVLTGSTVSNRHTPTSETISTATSVTKNISSDQENMTVVSTTDNVKTTSTFGFSTTDPSNMSTNYMYVSTKIQGQNIIHSTTAIHYFELPQTTTVPTVARTGMTTTAVKRSTENTVILSEFEKSVQQKEEPSIARFTTPKPVTKFVEQNSYHSDCMDETNVNIVFNPDTLRNTQIIAKEKTKLNSSSTHRSGGRPVQSGQHCETHIWQIGQQDNRNRELGPMLGNVKSLDFDINVHAPQKDRFPNSLYTLYTKRVFLRYLIPNNIHFRKGRLRLTCGLTGVRSNLTIGLSYYNRARRNPSKVQYKTFSPSKRVQQWMIPVKAVSPSLENLLQLQFDGSAGNLINFDFLKLEYVPTAWKTKRLFLQKSKKWKINGNMYVEKQNDKTRPDGMGIFIDGIKQKGVFADVRIQRKPNMRVLTVTDNGEIYVTHEARTRRQTERPTTSKLTPPITDVSGFTFGGDNRRIIKVNVVPKTSEITFTYDDGHFVKCSFGYTNARSNMIVVDTSFGAVPVRFFSTHLSNNLAAVNEVIIDGNKRKHIMKKDVARNQGTSFKFLKTSNNQVFKTNSETIIRFLRPRTH